MNRHALGVLEFGQVLELVAGRASTESGARVVRSLAPVGDMALLETEHSRTAAVRALVESETGFIPQPAPSIDQTLTRLRVPGAAIPAQELLAVAVVLRSSRVTKDMLNDTAAPPLALAVLAPFRLRLIADPWAESGINQVIADDGSVRDSASPSLRLVRRELRSAEGELIALLERVMGRLDSRYRVADMSVTVRNGRYVIPVRREGLVALGGLVHDTSSTGATLFVEPPAAIEACNRIRELEAEEVREVDRVLLELTDRLRPLHLSLADAAAALAELDALYARARFAIEFCCGPVSLTTPGHGCRILAARHPLMVAQGIAVVPFNLELAPHEYTLIVSGPNTGGKTVLLKTLGLLSAMAQAGLPVPADAGSSVVVFDDVFADVGDEQSIEASLSTFSAHLKNITEILASATDRCLVLLDELGSGTDPLEGAALGGAVLEALTERRALTVATSHLGALKELASEVPGVVNASLQFDAEALAPTFLLTKGVPGRSYGISIARRLGLSPEVLQRAEARIPQVERDVNALLVSLEKRDGELSKLERDARQSLESAREHAHRLADRESRLRDRERGFERDSRREARRYLLEARAEVERTIKRLKQSTPEGVDQAGREARQRVEQLAEEQRARLDALDSEGGSVTEPASEDDRELQPGDFVRIQALGGRTGRLLELRDGECLVLMGDVKMTFPRGDVARAPTQGRLADMSFVIRRDLPDAEVPTAIDIRGLRVGEIDEFVFQAIDAAIRVDLRSLRIIHGKGTGALRERVSEMLRKDTRVRTFRLGAWNEGGAGVTVVDL